MDIKNQWFTVSNNHAIARLVFIFRLQNLTQRVETYKSKEVKTQILSNFSVWYNLNQYFLRRRIRYDLKKSK
jgi:hypothetical protein